MCEVFGGLPLLFFRKIYAARLISSFPDYLILDGSGSPPARDCPFGWPVSQFFLPGFFLFALRFWFGPESQPPIFGVLLLTVDDFDRRKVVFHLLRGIASPCLYY